MSLEIKCPHCHKKCLWDISINPFRPFCSDRCKLIDLGDWASEKNKIPGEQTQPSSNSEDE